MRGSVFFSSLDMSVVGLSDSATLIGDCVAERMDESKEGSFCAASGGLSTPVTAPSAPKVRKHGAVGHPQIHDACLSEAHPHHPTERRVVPLKDEALQTLKAEVDEHPAVLDGVGCNTLNKVPHCHVRVFEDSAMRLVSHAICPASLCLSVLSRLLNAVALSLYNKIDNGLTE